MMKIHPALTPLDNDIIVTKRRYGAFAGSNLEVVLQSLDINHLILTGIATSGVVLSTVRDFGLHLIQILKGIESSFNSIFGSENDW